MASEPPRPTDFPKEEVLYVEAGATAYRGWATAAKAGDDQDVVLIARTKVQLAAAFKKLTGDNVNLTIVYPVVMLHRDACTLDDEL